MILSSKWRKLGKWSSYYLNKHNNHPRALFLPGPFFSDSHNKSPMLETQCIVNGKHLKVHYRKQFEKGDAYKGIIFSKSTIPFYCYALHDKLLLFEPRSLDQSLKMPFSQRLKVISY
jgi:hypothetical protein